MRYLKALGPLALAVVATMVGAGGASATVLTSPAGSQLGAGSAIKGQSTNTSWDGSVKISCKKTILEAEVTNPGGSGATVSAPVKNLEFFECGVDTYLVLKSGRLELHATSSGDGTMTWTGAEITAQLHRSILGFPVTTHCIYATNNTHIGTFTGSSSTGAAAGLDIGSSPIPEVATDGACGNDAVLTGTYTFTSPAYLDVD